MIGQVEIDKEIWALVLSGSRRTSDWPIRKVENPKDKGVCFRVNGSRYKGRIFLTASGFDERSSSAMSVNVMFVSDDNTTGPVELAQVSMKDMINAQKRNGASILEVDIERFKEEYGFA